jgi:hypothetical protein
LPRRTRIAFQSRAGNLAASDTNLVEDVFVRDMEQEMTYLVSSHVPGTVAGTRSVEPVISPDGRFVVFTASRISRLLVASDLLEGTTTVVATNRMPVIADSRHSRRGMKPCLTPIQPLLHDLVERTNRLVGFPMPQAGSPEPAVHEPELRRPVHRSPMPVPSWCPTPTTRDVFIHDALTATTTLVSARWGGTGAGNGECDAPTISADGRFVVYASLASDLVADDSDGEKSVFLYDRLSGRSALVSRSGAALPGALGWWRNPRLVPNAGAIMFESAADDLVAGDFNQTQDVFIYRFVVPPHVEVLGPSASGEIMLQWDVMGAPTGCVPGSLTEPRGRKTRRVTIAGSEASWAEIPEATATRRFYCVKRPSNLDPRRPGIDYSDSVRRLKTNQMEPTTRDREKAFCRFTLPEWAQVIVASCLRLPLAIPALTAEPEARRRRTPTRARWCAPAALCRRQPQSDRQQRLDGPSLKSQKEVPELGEQCVRNAGNDLPRSVTNIDWVRTEN